IDSSTCQLTPPEPDCLPPRGPACTQLIRTRAEELGVATRWGRDPSHPPPHMSGPQPLLNWNVASTSRRVDFNRCRAIWPTRGAVRATLHRDELPYVRNPNPSACHGAARSDCRGICYLARTLSRPV